MLDRMGSFARFITAGTANTLATYLLYIVLALILPYPIAYTCAYMAGIGLSYYLNTRFVFQTQMRLASAAGYPLVYLAQYLLGILLLGLLVERIGINRFFAPVIVIVASIPFTYVLSRLIIRGKV